MSAVPTVWFERAVRFREQGRIEESIEAYRKAIAEQPGLGLAHEQLAKLLYREGRSAEAAETYRHWHDLDPDHPIASHLCAATGGAPAPARASDEFVVDLFDRAASTFDVALESLGYQAPQLLVDRMRSTLAGSSHESNSPGSLTIVDLGCGTGLCGPLVREWARTLIGVDLSPEMLNRARERNVYDELHVAEVTEFLQSSRAPPVDVMLTADVFCYFGDLKPVLTAAAARLRPKGHLFFSVEHLDEPPDERARGFELQPHGRYAHSTTYVEQVLQAAGLTRDITPTYMLRFERGAPVSGLLVTAHG